MGRRIGLGHLETLVENLKRDLAWGAGTKFNGVEVAPNGILTPLL